MVTGLNGGLYLSFGIFLSGSGRPLPAGRAAPVEIVVLPVPGCKSPADGRLHIMDPASGFSFIGPREERAFPHSSSCRILPVADAGDQGKIFIGNRAPVDPSPVGKTDGNVFQDILAVCFKPQNQVFDDSFLPPPPPLATFAALEAVLVSCHPFVYQSGRISGLRLPAVFISGGKELGAHPS
jgi:hypothetical protein